jgi:hypothetical protein
MLSAQINVKWNARLMIRPADPLVRSCNVQPSDLAMHLLFMGTLEMKYQPYIR